MTEAQTAAASTPIAQSRRMFSWTTLQNIGGTLLLLVSVIGVFFTLRDKVETIGTNLGDVISSVRDLRQDVNTHSTQLAVQQTQIDDQSRKIDSLVNARADDRKLLEQVDNSVGILLDRSKPK